jgi:hypothetical protein
LTLATPDLAGQAGVALRNPKSISERKNPLMTINRITLAGFTGKDARSTSTKTAEA